MKTKIALIITAEGIETVTVLTTGPDARIAGYSLCSLLDDEINEFEAAIKRKVNQIDMHDLKGLKQ